MSKPTANQGSKGKTEGVCAEEQTTEPSRKSPTGRNKYHSVYGQLTERPRLRAAFERVKINRGAPGSDGVTISEFEKNLELHLTEIIQELRAKTYQPKPIRRVEIPKKSGGKRKLGIP